MSIAAMRTGSSTENIVTVSLPRMMLSTNPVKEAVIIAVDTAIKDMNIFSNALPLSAVTLKIIIKAAVAAAEAVSKGAVDESTEIAVKSDTKNNTELPYLKAGELFLNLK